MFLHFPTDLTFMPSSRQDDRQIKRLTASTYKDDVLRTLRKNQNHAHTCIWRFHREISPTQVLSIRGTEGHLGEEPPKFGNRMMVHALVKFDTEQVSVPLLCSLPLFTLVCCRVSRCIINVERPYINLPMASFILAKVSSLQRNAE